MNSILIKSSLLAVGGSLLESHYAPKSGCRSSFYGVTPLLLIGTGFWSVVHGMKVGAARTKYIELAKKDGEKDVDERYGLPNLYAQGTSKHVRAFNCIQRSHQHIFETFTQVCVAGLTAAQSYPLTAALTTLCYAVGRVSLSNGYAACEGEADKRYSSKLAPYTWMGMMSTFILGALSCGRMVYGKNFMTVPGCNPK